jgi:hypothetical protein
MEKTEFDSVNMVNLHAPYITCTLREHMAKNIITHCTKMSRVKLTKLHVSAVHNLYAGGLKKQKSRNT